MPDLGKRLYGPALLTTSSVVLYTAPAATTVFVRNLHVNNVTTSVASFTLAINAAATVSNSSLYYGHPVPGGGTFDWSGFLVLGAGDYIAAMSTNASTLTICISGVEST